MKHITEGTTALNKLNHQTCIFDARSNKLLETELKLNGLKGNKWRGWVMLSWGWKVSNLIKEKLCKQPGAVFSLSKLVESNIKRHNFYLLLKQILNIRYFQGIFFFENKQILFSYLLYFILNILSKVISVLLTSPGFAELDVVFAMQVAIFTEFYVGQTQNRMSQYWWFQLSYWSYRIRVSLASVSDV